MKKKEHVIGIFKLAMINAAAILSLRNLPITAEYGWASVLFYIVAAITFFIPTAFIAAELATGWPATGGIYHWVKEAFGSRCGFLMLWMQWAQNIFWYPTILSFVAGLVAYSFFPQLTSNQTYNLLMILGLFWAATFINFLGMQTSAWISTITVIIGTFVPAFILIILGFFWITLAHPSQIPFSWNALMPQSFKLDTIVFFVGILTAFAGIEMSAVHVKDVDNPKRNYPKAIALSTLVILLISILGTLAIAFVLPAKQISVVDGLIQAFKAFLQAYNLEYLTPVMGILITLGALGGVNTWTVGPCKAFLETAEDGDIPPYFRGVNKNGVPTRLLVTQGCIITVVAFVFMVLPNIESAYWILTAVLTQVYLVMYIGMFLAALKLRYSHPRTERPYRVPGGKNWGMWVWCLLGLIASFFAILISFVPPGQLNTGSLIFYECFMGVSLLLMFVIPLLIYQFKSPSWKNR